MGKLNGAYRYAAFAAAAFLIVFGLVGRDGDGQILMAIIAWPSSMIVGLLCEWFPPVCTGNAIPAWLVAFFGAIQFGFLGLLLGMVFPRRRPRNAGGA